MREVAPLRITTNSLNLKALLQHQTASLEADIHQPRAREVRVSEYRKHKNASGRLGNLTRCSLVGKVEG